MRSPCILLLAALTGSLASTFVGPRPTCAECRIETPDLNSTSLAVTPSAPVGQSFVACQDGFITSIVVRLGLSSQQSVRLGLQAGTDLLAPTFSETRNIPTGAVRILFTPWFPVANGTTYSFSLTPEWGVLRLQQIPPSSYADGTLIQVVEGVSVAQASDLKFLVTFSDLPVPASIATWGALKTTYR